MHPFGAELAGDVGEFTDVFPELGNFGVVQICEGASGMPGAVRGNGGQGADSAVLVLRH